jgi:hypothetical protein
MADKLTKNYNPRVRYNAEFPLNHPINESYVSQLAKWAMERIKSSAKPYHQKHNGVKDNGTTGKEVTVTLDELEQIIINSNGKSPNGVDIHFAPVGVLRKPGDAEKVGLVTNEQRSRFPSVDRINSLLGYSADNIQLTTKSYNLGKSSNDVSISSQIAEKITLKWKGAEVELNHITSSFLASTLKELTA